MKHIPVRIALILSLDIHDFFTCDSIRFTRKNLSYFLISKSIRTFSRGIPKKSARTLNELKLQPKEKWENGTKIL